MPTAARAQSSTPTTLSTPSSRLESRPAISAATPSPRPNPANLSCSRFRRPISPSTPHLRCLRPHTPTRTPTCLQTNQESSQIKMLPTLELESSFFENEELTQALQLETPRLILRRWQEADRAPFAAMNADPVVMRFFASPFTTEQSNRSIDRYLAAFDREGFSFFAATLRDTGAF